MPIQEDLANAIAAEHRREADGHRHSSETAPPRRQSRKVLRHPLRLLGAGLAPAHNGRKLADAGAGSCPETEPLHG
jgi:hypothetical protein